MRSGIRFDPPEVELSTGLCWVLQRAFGPPGILAGKGREIDAKPVVKLARSLSLTERIGSRIRAEVLEAELGDEDAARFREATTQSAVLSIAAEKICREIAELGSELGVPVIFLKGAALQLAERVTSGSRNMCDVDVLAPEDGARRLQRALVEGGCTALEVRESEHQLQFLTHGTGLGIEVHKIIPGVRLGGGASATAGELIERGLAHPAPELEDGCYLPSDDVVLAHLLVHGISQHGMSPEGYPIARMMADVQDLEIDEACLEAFLDGGFAWIAADVSREEVVAAAGLVWRLGAGEDPAVVAAAEDGVGALLRHFVAGTMDEEYAYSMKFRSLAAKPRDIGRLRAVAKTLRGALLPTRAQIDILYGPPRTELGYWGWRLWRPFDVVLRALRYGWAWLRHRSKRNR